MSLSRKRRRDLKKLRAQAEELLDQQRFVLGNAGSVLHEAGRQAKFLSNEHLAPRVNEAVDTVRPTVDRGVFAARKAANQVRRVAAPVVATALANTVRTLEQLETGEAAQQLRTFGERRGILTPAKKKSNAGGIIAVGIGVVAAVAAGLALWQAFRTDDELWVASEDAA